MKNIVAELFVYILGIAFIAVCFIVPKFVFGWSRNGHVYALNDTDTSIDNYYSNYHVNAEVAVYTDIWGEEEINQITVEADRDDSEYQGVLNICNGSEILETLEFTIEDENITVNGEKVSDYSWLPELLERYDNEEINKRNSDKSIFDGTYFPMADKIAQKKSDVMDDFFTPVPEDASLKFLVKTEYDCRYMPTSITIGDNMYYVNSESADKLFMISGKEKNRHKTEYSLWGDQLSWISEIENDEGAKREYDSRISA